MKHVFEKKLCVENELEKRNVYDANTQTKNMRTAYVVARTDVRCCSNGKESA